VCREVTKNHRELKMKMLRDLVKILIVLLVGIVISNNLSFGQSEDEINEDECRFNSIKLFGKIKFVESFPGKP